jgi:hypothetical protein
MTDTEDTKEKNTEDKWQRESREWREWRELRYKYTSDSRWKTKLDELKFSPFSVNKIHSQQYSLHQLIYHSFGDLCKQYYELGHAYFISRVDNFDPTDYDPPRNMPFYTKFYTNTIPFEEIAEKTKEDIKIVFLHFPERNPILERLISL